MRSVGFLTLREKLSQTAMVSTLAWAVLVFYQKNMAS